MKGETADFDVHQDVVVEPGGPDLLVYCTLKHNERGNGYGHLDNGVGEDVDCGIFYVSRKDFAELCRKFLEHDANIGGA